MLLCFLYCIYLNQNHQINIIYIIMYLAVFSCVFRVVSLVGPCFFFRGLAPPWFSSPFGDFLRFWSSGPRVPGALVPYSSGPVVWSPGPGPLVLWSPGPLFPWSSSGSWSFGPMVLVLWSSGRLVLWSLDPLVFGCGFWKDRNTANYSLWSL